MVVAADDCGVQLKILVVDVAVLAVLVVEVEVKVVAGLQRKVSLRWCSFEFELVRGGAFSQLGICHLYGLESGMASKELQLIQGFRDSEASPAR